MEILINMIAILLAAIAIGGPLWVLYRACPDADATRPMERILAIEAHYRAIARFKLAQRLARRPVAPYC